MPSDRKTPLWESIANDLRDAIAAGHYKPGDKLPTEAELAARFGVNRHTVRQALSHLIDAKIAHSRRGAGTFVLAKPTEYPIGKRVRFHQNITASGQRPTKSHLSIETRACDASEARLLQLETGAPVVVSTGISLADALPVAMFQSVYPADRLPGFAEALAAHSSVTKALEVCGVTDYTRASTRITATAATATQAAALQIAQGAPLVFSTSVNVDDQGVPVEFGKTWFPGDRVTLTFDE